jgi:cation diffusion facilitator CzcD-associated flavoprotein CzcO
VIGAGICGLTAIKNLCQAGIADVTCFEVRDVIAGQWAYTERPSSSSVYAATHTISSKRCSSFDDFPMPADFPDFPSHRQILSYFNAYADQFGLRPHIRLRTAVERIGREPDGAWRLSLDGPDGASSDTFTHLVVCTGHHSHPVLPAYPGSFAGTALHSHDYKTAAPFAGKRVLVVGGGNSACDIAVDLSAVAARTAISMRRGYHIIPKIILGSPADVALAKIASLPKWMRDRAAAAILRIVVGQYRKYGLRQPATGLMRMHPTLNSRLLDALRHGTIQPRGAIEALAGDAVRFADGRTEPFDAIIWATGYRMQLPDLGLASLSSEPVGALPLYLKMIPQEADNLFIIGHFQPFGCIWTLADLQARIAALMMAGRLARPDRLHALIEREMSRRSSYDPSERHMSETDALEFGRELRAQIARA